MLLNKQNANYLNNNLKYSIWQSITHQLDCLLLVFLSWLCFNSSMRGWDSLSLHLNPSDRPVKTFSLIRFPTFPSQLCVMDSVKNVDLNKSHLNILHFYVIYAYGKYGNCRTYLLNCSYIANNAAIKYMRIWRLYIPSHDIFGKEALLFNETHLILLFPYRFESGRSVSLRQTQQYFINPIDDAWPPFIMCKWRVTLQHNAEHSHMVRGEI